MVKTKLSPDGIRLYYSSLEDCWVTKFLFDLTLKERETLPLSAPLEICKDESPIEDLTFAFAEKLKVLLAILERTQQSTNAVSSEEIAEILFDLGLWLQYTSEASELNSDVFEDPLNRGDAIGNVLMISKRRSRPETNLLSPLGDHLVDLGHKLLEASRKIQTGWSIAEDLYFQYESDDSRSEEVLAAKKLISEIRKENVKLDRRNSSLWLQLQKAKEALKRIPVVAQPPKVIYEDVWEPQVVGTGETVSSGFRIKSYSTPSESSEHQPICKSSSDDSGMLKTQSRKLDMAQNADSQVDFKW